MLLRVRQARTNLKSGRLIVGVHLGTLHLQTGQTEGAKEFGRPEGLWVCTLCNNSSSHLDEDTPETVTPGHGLEAGLGEALEHLTFELGLSDF